MGERTQAWAARQENISLDDQPAELPTLKAPRVSHTGVHAQVAHNVAVRLDLARHAF